jgi:hypothetical protein
MTFALAMEADLYTQYVYRSVYTEYILNTLMGRGRGGVGWGKGGGGFLLNMAYRKHWLSYKQCTAMYSNN